MAANFWTSSHYKKLLDQEEVGIVHPTDKEHGLTQEDIKIIKIQMSNWEIYTVNRQYGQFWETLSSESERLQDRHENMVVATAVAYFRRVYTRSLVNDSYRTDLILIYPPYMIALACIYVVSVLKDKDTHAWFEELRVDMNVIKNISMEIVDHYDNYRNIPEGKIVAALNKLPQGV